MSYFIADLRIMQRPRVFKDEFPTREQAQDTMEEHFGTDYFSFDIISQDDVIKHNLKVVNKSLVSTLAYDYPPHKVDPQQRKTYRTTQRKKLRNSGGLYKIYFIDYFNLKGTESYTIKEANEKMPNNTSRCFVMERTPDLLYCMLEMYSNPVPGSELIWQVIRCMVYNRRTHNLYPKNVFFYKDDSFYETPIRYYYENLREGMQQAEDLTNYKLFGLS